MSNQELVVTAGEIADILTKSGFPVKESVLLPGRSARNAPVPIELHPRLYEQLTREFPSGLYSHQSTAISASIGGADVCLATPTASGKSLVFMSVAAHCTLTDRFAKVLAIYPAKALIQDQLTKWEDALGAYGIRAGFIDGSVPTSERGAILDACRVVAMTPDVLHAWLMSHLAERQVRSFLNRLKLLVLDEAHVYPVCLVCGQTRSPFASTTELDKFGNEHRDRCGQEVKPTGFFADVIADSLTLRECESADEAYSLAEALRIGASQVLDMDREDLEVLVIRQPGSELADAILYDPMPGGSGLLEQLCARFSEVVAAALKVVESCPSVCERSCVDCLQTFRNAFYHRYLDRQLAASRLTEWGSALTVEHAIPARFPSVGPEREDMPSNRAEALLRHLLTRAGLPEPEWKKPIDLGRPLNTTWPDCFWPVEDEPGLCLYMDGLSGHIHGHPTTREVDRAIRDTLRSKHYEVLEVTATQLHDRDAMVQIFKKIARILIGRDRAKAVQDDVSWYEIPQAEA